MRLIDAPRIVRPLPSSTVFSKVRCVVPATVVTHGLLWDTVDAPGPAFPAVVSLAVAVILYDAGLSLDLRRMETAYFERNKRELELTKHISVRRLDPAALIQLRETGVCEVEIPEALFNLDFPSHYLRRLKSVSLTIPSVVGPYTGVHATLTLLSNRTRVSTVDPHEHYTGVEDPHFVTNVGGIQAIATSTGREDGGLFELNLRDERYLPFEGAGAVGRWLRPIARMQAAGGLMIASK